MRKIAFNYITVQFICLFLAFLGFQHFSEAAVTISDCEPTDRDSTMFLTYTNLSVPLRTYSDSVKSIPAYDIYCQWDTSIIHPYHFSLESFEEEIKLKLIDAQSCNFVIPCPGHINSAFGSRHRQVHFGVDLHLITGDTVVGAFDGLVRIAKLNSSYGNVVIIRHANGLETIYAHLSKILVKPNQTIRAGDAIGLGGNTGHSFGSHLHFEVRYKGEPINPTELISFDTHSLKSDSLILTKNMFQSLNYITSHVVSNYSKKYPKKNKFITVKKGDTIYSIARQYHLSAAQLLKVNKLKSTSILRVGTVLKCS